MCKSVQGAAYFGSSLHLAFSFIFLFWFIFDTVISEININLWKCDPPEPKFSDIDPVAHYLNLLFKLFYFVALCVTGVYVFRGVERERPQLLKFAVLAFIITQIIGVVLFSIFFSIQWNAEPVDSADSIEAARLTAVEEAVAGLSESANATEGIEIKNDQPEPTPTPKTVTPPMISEAVLPAPDVSEPTTTPIPPPPIVTTTTKPPPTTAVAPIPEPPVSPCNTPECPGSPQPPKPKRKLPHNQLVRLVFQMLLVIVNGLASVTYVIVLGLFMLKL